jgi:prephenate dehydrogenase
MKNIRIGIIGGTGGIGRWFAHFFQKEGFEVHVSGRKTGLAFPDLVRKCPIIIVSVPIKATVGVIEQVGPLMPEKSLLMDFTSLKEEPVKAMLRSSRCEVIGLHPLFGPEIKALVGHNIVICPARTEKWLLRIKAILKKSRARIIETTPERHDEWMAMVQVLNHLNTITMGLALKRSGFDLKELYPVSTPAFDSKIELLKKIFGPNAGLYTQIITHNPHSDRVFKDYQQSLSELKKMIIRKDSEGLQKKIEKTKLFVPV